MRKILIGLLVLLMKYGYAQNLIPNPSFEDTLCLWPIPGNACWDFYGSVHPCCIDWYDPGGFIPDYFHANFNKIDSIWTRLDMHGNPGNGVPNNYFGNNIYPRTGNAYAGISTLILFTHGESDTNVAHPCFDREIIGVNLKSTLVAGKCYKVRFYVTTSNRRVAFFTDAIDVNFSSQLNFSYQNYQNMFPDSLNFLVNCLCGGLYGVYNYFSPPTYSTPRGVFFSDTTGWMKVEFEYVAHGNEKQVSIGVLRANLCNDAEFLHVGTSESWNFNESDSGHYYSVYHYYDDVSVYPCDAPEYPADIGIKDTCINKGSPIVLGGLPKEEYLYWWYDSHDSLISRQSSITVYPTQDTNFVLVQKDFKFDETRDTVHIKVGNCLPLPPDYSGYDFAIYPNPNYGDFQVRFNTAVPEGAVLELYDLLGRKLAEYPLSGSGNIANLNGIEVASAIYYATVVVPNSFRKSVKMVIMK